MSSPSEQGTAPEAIALLLVGDDEHAARRLHEVLRRPEGTRFDITHVPDVDSALSQLQGRSYDVLLLDLSIHEADGLDSLLRARVAARSVPIVVLTYQRDEAVALKAARAGAQDYLTRGEVTPELITRTLLHAVERHRILRDLTEAQKRQHFLATHDTLTELPNRYSFLEQLAGALADAERRHTQLAVLFLDLDGFKAVNDDLGHVVGDELLSEAARRLRRMVRRSDLVARLGGDEFVAAIRGFQDLETLTHVADQIRQEIARPYDVAGHECSVSASIGIAIYPNDGADSDLLIHCADAAMYQAKSVGKNQVCLFDGDLNASAAERFKLVKGVRESIRAGQLGLMFEPRIQVSPEAFVGARALALWEDSARPVSPSEFITVADESGNMLSLCEWALRAACTAAMGWRDLEDTRVAVDIGRCQLDQVEFPDRVAEILGDTGLAPGRLELELEESLASGEPAQEMLARLRELGVRIALRGFGTGYASLALLKRLPVDALEIDPSLVRGARDSEADAVILEAIVRMAATLGLAVRAGGVDTLEEMDSLLAWGCREMQGDLLAKPLPAREFEAAVTSSEAPWRAAVQRPEG